MSNHALPLEQFSQPQTSPELAPAVDLDHFRTTGVKIPVEQISDSVQVRTHIGVISSQDINFGARGQVEQNYTLPTADRIVNTARKVGWVVKDVLGLNPVLARPTEDAPHLNAQKLAQLNNRMSKVKNT